jgi:hypothetical protein
MPDLIRHPDVVPTKVGNHLRGWIPVYTGNPGFRLEFTPYLIRGRNDNLSDRKREMGQNRRFHV